MLSQDTVNEVQSVSKKVRENYYYKELFKFLREIQRHFYENKFKLSFLGSHDMPTLTCIGFQ